MSRVLIVHAHEETKSFNGAMRDTAIRVLSAQGHEVTVSDLYAMDFDPVGGKRDFTALSDPAYFKYGVEQTIASEKNTFASDVAGELEKLLAADLLIFQFPLWWFGLPAILKGWVDRVFVAGRIYGAGKWYDQGVMKGKRAMLSMTTGGGPTIYSPTGLNGDIRSILYPIEHGMLYFVGYDVLPTFIAYAPARITPEARGTILSDYEKHLGAWQTLSPIKFPTLDAYDESFQLKSK